MQCLCMTSKTISLHLDAYEKLRRARRHPGESFSQVVLRGTWAEATISAGDLLSRLREEGPFLDPSALARIESLKAADLPPEDKWSGS